jgi:hypothetical protein
MNGNLVHQGWIVVLLLLFFLNGKLAGVRGQGQQRRGVNIFEDWVKAIYFLLKACFQAYQKSTILFFVYFGTHNNKIHTIYKPTSVFVFFHVVVLVLLAKQQQKKIFN